MRWMHHEIQHIVSKSNQLSPCNKIHIVPHKMEPAYRFHLMEIVVTELAVSAQFFKTVLEPPTL